MDSKLSVLCISQTVTNETCFVSTNMKILLPFYGLMMIQFTHWNILERNIGVLTCMQNGGLSEVENFLPPDL